MMDRWSTVINKPVVDPVIIEKEKRAVEMRERIETDLRIARSYDTKHSNATREGHSFELSLSDWIVLMNQPVCAYSGKKFDARTHPRTMERINPCLGYTVENTIAVTSHANTEKSRLDAFVKGNIITDEMKLKLLRKAVYQLEKRIKGN